jgi:aspartate carbamoyltransferase catalytic subunit
MSLELSLEAFLALPDAEKAPLVAGRAALFAQQFDRAFLDRIARIADAARLTRSTPGGAAFLQSLLPHRMALNVFAQPSSRTFLSFHAAQAILGMPRVDIRDVSQSSMAKGESLEDSIHTFATYADLIVMRDANPDAGSVATWVCHSAGRRVSRPDGQRIPVPVISGGSGAEQHPTQALLDVYTLQRELAPVGGLDGKCLLLVGDLARGRTVRSLALLAHHFPHLSLRFASPERYAMRQDILDHLDAHGVPWATSSSLDDGLVGADAVYMTRVQDEHDAQGQGGHPPSDPAFRFELRHLERLAPHAPLLHPLPKRDEIDPAVDRAEDRRVAYWRQERNGMWVRVALIAELFGVSGAILERHG